MNQNQRVGSGLHVRGWHSRGYLPHFDGGELAQFVTFHLGDSLPQKVLERWKRLLSHLEDEESKKVLQQRIEKYLDQGYGNCYLKDERVAESVQNSLLYFDSERYRLYSWVIMPNHVHLILTPVEPNTLSSIMHSLKSFNAKEANKILNRKGTFWQEDYFDRFIRDAEHFEKCVAYIEKNPVKACLCNKTSEWKFSSAYFRAQE